MKWKRVTIIVLALWACLAIVFVILMTANPQEEDMTDTNETVTYEGIVKEFEENHETFEKVAKYISENTEGFNVYKFSDAPLNDIDGNPVDIDSLEIGDEIKLIIFELNYYQIMDGLDYVYFFKSGRAFENGIFFVKDSTTPKSNNQRPVTLIKDNWYYYEFYGT